MQVSIYKIVCPFTNEVKYVGKTINSLDYRLKGHITNPTSKDMGLFIKSTISNGCMPIIELIELVDESSSKEREQYWINVYRELVPNLLNCKNVVYKNISTSSDSVNRKVKYMVKKGRNIMLTKRFNDLDIGHWQNMANVETGGNLTLWIELTLNKAVKVVA